MNIKNNNLIKKVSMELGVTYKELGEAVGYSENTIKQSVSKDKLSLPLQKAIKLYVENLELKNRLQEYTFLQKTLKNIILK